MSEGNSRKIEALDRLAEELIQDILLSSDEEILSEAAESEPNLAQYLTNIKSVYRSSKKAVGRQAFAAARLAVQKDKSIISKSNVLGLSAESCWRMSSKPILWMLFL